MKEFFASLLDRPTVLILLAGLASLLLGAAGTIDIAGQKVAVADPVWRIALGVIGLLLTGFGVALIVRDTRQPRPATPLKLTHDVFLASPMASVKTKAEFDALRDTIRRIKEALRAEAGVQHIFDSGDGLEFGKWEPEDFSAEIDVEALRKSRNFILVYPEKIVSSVLFEAGIAVGLGKPAIYIVPDANGLPFLMQQLNNLPAKYPKVRIWECSDTDRIIARIRQSGARIFTDAAASAEATPAPAP